MQQVHLFRTRLSAASQFSKSLSELKIKSLSSGRRRTERCPSLVFLGKEFQILRVTLRQYFQTLGAAPETEISYLFYNPDMVWCLQLCPCAHFLSPEQKNLQHIEVIPYLHDRTGSQHLLFNVGFTGGATNRCEETHGIFGRDCFASTRFATDNDGLVLLIPVEQRTRKIL